MGLEFFEYIEAEAISRFSYTDLQNDIITGKKFLLIFAFLKKDSNKSLIWTPSKKPFFYLSIYLNNSDAF